MIKSHIIGRLGKDAEEVQAGQRTALRFTVASDDRKKDQNGQWVKETTWVSVHTYQTGLKPYLTKGKQVMVSGDLRIGIWTKSDGTAQVDAAVFGADVTLLAGESTPQAPQAAPQAPQSTQRPQAAQQPTQPTQPLPGLGNYAQGGNDDLPF